MPTVRRSALVPYPPQTMFDLVADVERYPEFLPWCRAAVVHRREPDAITASLELARGPIRRRFTTRNRMVSDERIEIELVDGPFERLEGTWRFEALADHGCRVALDLEFEFSSRLLRHTLQPVFGEIASSMVDAFCRRAAEVHGAA